MTVISMDADTISVEDLVAEYQRTRASETFDAIHTRCRGLVRFAARPIFRRFPWAEANADEVLAVGVQALWRAAIRYRPDGGAKFSYYAHECIRLAMRGYVLRAINQQAEAPDSLDAVSAKFGDTLLDRLADRRQARPEDEPDIRDRPARLLAIVERYCPKRQALFIRLYYFEGLKLREISEREGITKERVRQILKRGLARLARVIEDPTLQLRPAWRPVVELQANSYSQQADDTLAAAVSGR